MHSMLVRGRLLVLRPGVLLGLVVAAPAAQSDGSRRSRLARWRGPDHLVCDARARADPLLRRALRGCGRHPGGPRPGQALAGAAGGAACAAAGGGAGGRRRPHKVGEGLTHHNVLYEWAALDRLLHLPDGGPSVSYLPLAHIAERGPTIYSPLVEARAGAFCPEPTDVLAQVQHARPLAFFGVPRVWEKVWSGLIAKLDAEPPRRRRRRLADAALAAGRPRLGCTPATSAPWTRPGTCASSTARRS